MRFLIFGRAGISSNQPKVILFSASIQAWVRSLSGSSIQR